MSEDIIECNEEGKPKIYRYSYCMFDSIIYGDDGEVLALMRHPLDKNLSYELRERTLAGVMRIQDDYIKIRTDAFPPGPLPEFATDEELAGERDWMMRHFLALKIRDNMEAARRAVQAEKLLLGLPLDTEPVEGIDPPTDRMTLAQERKRAQQARMEALRPSEPPARSGSTVIDLAAFRGQVERPEDLGL